MDYLPKDPAILVSSVNMLLRDEEFDSLESLCYAFSREPKEIKDYLYRKGFVWKDLSLLHIALIYLAVINVVTFFMYGIDKWKAKKSKWRIREAALIGLAVLGGSVGAWLGMKVWHHKTLHKKFKFGVPAIIIVQLSLIAYYLYE